MFIVKKIELNGRIDRFLVSHQGRFDIIPKNQILNYQFENATVRSDYSVVKKKGYKDIETVDYKNCKVLFHGSKYGLGKIDLGNRSNTDFGSGLYLNDNKSRAEKWIHSYNSHRVYVFFLDMSGLKVYRFKNSDLWLYYIAYNRNVIKYKNLPREIQEEIKKINLNDIIVGPIADDSMFQSMNDFLHGSLSFEGLGYCLKYINLGTQYTLKTQKAVNQLVILDEYSLSKNQVNLYARLRVEELRAVANINVKARLAFSKGRSVLEVLRGYEI